MRILLFISSSLYGRCYHYSSGLWCAYCGFVLYSGFIYSRLIYELFSQRRRLRSSCILNCTIWHCLLLNSCNLLLLLLLLLWLRLLLKLLFLQSLLWLLLLLLISFVKIVVGFHYIIDKFIRKQIVLKVVRRWRIFIKHWFIWVIFERLVIRIRYFAKE